MKIRHIFTAMLLTVAIMVGNSLSAQWQQTDGPHGGIIMDFEVIGTDIFAATLEGIYISTNNGADWSPVNSGLSQKDVYSLAASGGDLYAGTGKGIYHTSNNGASWTLIGLPNSSVRPLAADGSTLFAGTYESNVFVSTNGGAIWTNVTTGIPNGSKESIIISGNDVFVATTTGVYRSSNLGAGWTAVNSGLPSTVVNKLVLDGTDLYAATNQGVFKSTNNGAQWTSLGGPNGVKSLALIGSNIFAATYGGVYHSPDNGLTWNPANTGINYNYIRSIAVVGTDLFAGSGGGSYGRGILKSSNQGASWASVGIINTAVHGLEMVNSNLFASVDTGGTFLSTNPGGSWQWQGQGIKSMVFSYLPDGNDIFAGGVYGVYHTSNNGTNWTLQNNGLPNDPVSDLVMQGTDLFAATTGGGVYLSTNGGTNWSMAVNGLTDLFVNDLLVNGSDLFAATKSGVFHSGNNGISWNSMSSGLNGSVWSLAAMGSSIYAGTMNGVYISTNNGATWAPSTLSSVEVRSLIVSGSTLFAGTGNGVYYSTDNGSTWNLDNNGLGNINVLTMTASNTHIFVGTAGSGVWYREISQITGMPGEMSRLDLQAYPSPFENDLYINLPDPVTGQATVDLYDITGRKTMAKFTNHEVIGESIKLNLAGLSPGVYLVRVQTDKGTGVCRVLKK